MSTRYFGQSQANMDITLIPNFSFHALKNISKMFNNFFNIMSFSLPVCIFSCLFLPHSFFSALWRYQKVFFCTQTLDCDNDT